MTDVTRLPLDIQEKIYKPGEEEDFFKDIQFPASNGFGEDDEVTQTVEIDLNDLRE